MYTSRRISSFFCHSKKIKKSGDFAGRQDVEILLHLLCFLNSLKVYREVNVDNEHDGVGNRDGVQLVASPDVTDFVLLRSDRQLYKMYITRWCVLIETC